MQFQLLLANLFANIAMRPGKKHRSPFRDEGIGERPTSNMEPRQVGRLFLTGSRIKCGMTPHQIAEVAYLVRCKQARNDKELLRDFFE